jgi:hypothetical protein
MQNKPNFRKAKMNVNIYYIKDYQIFIPLAGQKNKPNSNPIYERPKSLAGKSGHNHLLDVLSFFRRTWSRKLLK